MRPVNRTYAPLQALADELVRCGMTHAVTCPGSRNAPLIYALAETEGLEAVSVLDERAAGFMALGIAKASGRPVAVTCTSGTAAANLYPAVIEAYEARVPLIVLTADRPPELRDTGAGQAIDQLKLYGSAAKWFVEVGNHEPGRDAAIYHRALACRAWATAAGGRPGPVHLNFPLREPLAPAPEELDRGGLGRPPRREAVGRGVGAARVRGGRAGHATSRTRAACSSAGRAPNWPRSSRSPRSRPRPAGRSWPSRPPAFAAARTTAATWSRTTTCCCATSAGPARTSPSSRSASATRRRRSRCVPGSRAPSRSCSTRTRPGTSRRARAQWIAAADPAPHLRRARRHDRRSPKDPAWLEEWRAADALVSAGARRCARPARAQGVGRARGHRFPRRATVWVSSSMPIRDVETFFPSVSNPIRFLANRGANGIDGDGVRRLRARHSRPEGAGGS